jgi:hypothetical protein
MKFYDVNKNGIATQFYCDWHEITGTFKKIVEQDWRYKSERANQFVDDWSHDSSFIGAKPKEMLRRLHQGYDFPPESAPSVLPYVESYRRRPRYTDDPEGDYDHDLYMNGETEYFLTKPKRESLIGLRLKIRYDFNCKVSSKFIAEYGQWVGTVIESLQTRGYDLEIMVMQDAHHTFDHGRDGNDQQMVRVSKFGERVMPRDWAALFSPGGYRMLLWQAMFLGADSSSHELTYTLGKAQGERFDISWEPKEREITFHVNSTNVPTKYPAENMTKKFESWTDR